MSIEEHGDYYIEQRTVTDPSGERHRIFDVGHIIEVGGKRLPKHLSERSFWNRAEALKWIESQAK